MKRNTSSLPFLPRQWRSACCLSRAAFSTITTTHTDSSSKTPVDIEQIKSRPAKLIHDYLTPMPSHLLTTTLSDLLGHKPPSSFSASTGLLPQGHHLVYFPLQTPASRLAPDGADADHAPSPEFTRRLWAGGQVVFRRPLPKGGLVRDGRAWTCIEKIEDVRVQGQSSTEKVFVDVWRRYALGHEDVDEAREWDIEERRTLVFMRKPASSSSASTNLPPSRLIRYPHQPTYSTSLLPTPRHLFHFSALTYSAHAIHIDPLYAQSQDGHRALLVHGPLSLALMLRVLTDHIGGQNVASISYRNYAPLYVGERMNVCVRRTNGKGGSDGRGEQVWDVWVEGPEGGLAVKGSAVVWE